MSDVVGALLRRDGFDEASDYGPERLEVDPEFGTTG